MQNANKDCIHCGPDMTHCCCCFPVRCGIITLAIFSYIGTILTVVSIFAIVALMSVSSSIQDDYATQSASYNTEYNTNSNYDTTATVYEDTSSTVNELLIVAVIM